ncbi:phosphotransferase [Streptomyces avicenniae]|uniref:phosphotransferase n=1 Tax=Streptomyces avicenniae TaxID=500153 RepID=UPI00069A11F9|nr:phosphotransferase [Streptomyces avicenniae]
MELIASGRDADVYALDGHRVLRRYRHGGPTEREARLMAYVAEHGYPVPRVHDVDGADMVMERLAGPTMVEVLARRPWRVRRLGRQLGALHDRLHAIPAPGWLPVGFAGTDDDRVLHLDLHPGNVVLTGRGPVVIDWRNAAAGAPAADLAMTLVTVGTADIPWPVVRAGRGLLLRGLRAGSRADPGPWLRAAVETRRGDPNVTAREAARLRAFAEAPGKVSGDG